MEKPSSEDIQKIMKENTINIPAGMLYTFLQFTEIGSQRGAFKANELSMIGNIYDSGTFLLNKLINEQWKPPEKTITLEHNEASLSIEKKDNTFKVQCAKSRRFPDKNLRKDNKVI